MPDCSMSTIVIDPDGTELTRVVRYESTFNILWVKYFTNNYERNIHRTDGPAIVYYHTNTTLVHQALYFQNNLPWIGDDQPFEKQYELKLLPNGAALHYLSGECWMRGHEFHREYKPAVIHYDSFGVIIRAEYHKNGIEIDNAMFSDLSPGTIEWEFTYDMF